MSIFAFFSSPPAAAMTTCPLLVTMTNRCRFFSVLAPKKRWNLLGVSAFEGSPFLDVGLWGGGEVRRTTTSIVLRKSMASCE